MSHHIFIKNLKISLQGTFTGPGIPNFSQMWYAKPKELPTPDLESGFDSALTKKSRGILENYILPPFITMNHFAWSHRGDSYSGTKL